MVLWQMFYIAAVAYYLKDLQIYTIYTCPICTGTTEDDKNATNNTNRSIAKV
jgi:hypothetical protein